MSRFLVFQSSSQRSLVFLIVGVSKMEQECHHLVLLSSGKGSQFIFDLQDVHDRKVKEAEALRKQSPMI